MRRHLTALIRAWLRPHRSVFDVPVPDVPVRAPRTSEVIRLERAAIQWETDETMPARARRAEIVALFRWYAASGSGARR